MEEDFTEGAIHDQPTRRQWSIDPPFDARVRQLVRDWDTNQSPELIEEMIVTALKIARDRMSIADLKLINRSIKEMRNAAKVFAPFQELRKVAIFGSARTPTEQRANEIIEGDPKLITLNYFFTRKLNFVKEAHAFALFYCPSRPPSRTL